MATILSGGRIGRATDQTVQPQTFNQTQAPQEESVEPSIAGKIVRPLAKFGAAALGAPQDIYQTIEGIVSNPNVQKAIAGPAGELIDLLPGGRLPIPERIPFLPNSSEIKEKATEAGEPIFGKGFMQAEGNIENIIDRTAEFLPSALFAAATGGSSLLRAGAGALGSGVGAEIGSAFGAPGEFVGTVLGDIVGKNTKVLKNLKPTQIHEYMSKKRDQLWKSSENAAKRIWVPKDTIKKIADPIYAEELKITKDYPSPEKRDSAVQSTIDMLSHVKEKIDAPRRKLSDLFDARKFVNEYFKKNLTPYQEQRAKYAHKIIKEGIDEAISKSGNENLAKDYKLANVLSKSVKKSNDLQKSLQESGLWVQLKNNPGSSAIGAFFAIPKLISNPFSTAAAATAGAYAAKKLAPVYHYSDPRLLPLLGDISKSLDSFPLNREMVAKSVKTFMDQAKKIEKQDKIEAIDRKKSGPVIISGGRKPS